MRVLAVDPGGVTGMACRTENGVHVLEAEPLVSVDIARRLLQEDGIEQVVVERFTVTARTLKVTRQYDALEVIGALRWLAHSFELPFELQNVADVKRLITDTRLKEFGLWHPSPGGHMNDACRHLAYFEWRQRAG